MVLFPRANKTAAADGAQTCDVTSLSMDSQQSAKPTELYHHLYVFAAVVVACLDKIRVFHALNGLLQTHRDVADLAHWSLSLLMCIAISRPSRDCLVHSSQKIKLLPILEQHF